MARLQTRPLRRGTDPLQDELSMKLPATLRIEALEYIYEAGSVYLARGQEDTVVWEAQARWCL